VGRIGRLAVWLVAPLLVIFGVVFAIYGSDGPPDNERVNSAARLIGVVYGIYAVVMTLVWRRSGPR
jgi:hypothetical protein